MKNKTKLFIFILITILTFSLSSCTKTKYITTISPQDVVIEFLDQNFYKAITRQDKVYMKYNSINGLVSSLGDRYTYISPISLGTPNDGGDKYKPKDEHQAGFGIGIEAYNEFKDFKVKITKIYENSPAFKKLYPNDLILGYSFLNDILMIDRVIKINKDKKDE